MKKILFFLTITFVIISYFSCSNQSTVVSPSSVSFIVTHQLNQIRDSLYFSATPTQDVNVNFIKIYRNNLALDSGNVTFAWSKNTAYEFASELDSNAVYKFDFKGSFQSGGSSFDVTAVDTVH